MPFTTQNYDLNCQILRFPSQVNVLGGPPLDENSDYIIQWHIFDSHKPHKYLFLPAVNLLMSLTTRVSGQQHKY